MLVGRVSQRLALRSMMICGLFLISACGTMDGSQRPGLNPELVSMAVQRATDLHAAGGRVWCVPFARNASGIEIRGNAGTWWRRAENLYPRGKQPVEGAVMAFSATRGLPLGHVAVVSEVLSDRHILIDHANWRRNRVSQGMGVIDVSEDNDWSAVRVESNPGQYGRIYRIDGFILPVEE